MYKFQTQRKAVSALLAAGMIAAVTTGCGQAQTPETSSQVASGETTAGTQAVAETEEPLDIKMTVRLFDQVPDMNNAYWQEFQKRTNTKLEVEWIPDGDYITKLNLIFSSRDLPEVLVANPSNNLNNPPFVNAVKNGAFWDLTDYLGDFSKYPNLLNNEPKNAWVYSRVLGRNYGVPRSQPQVAGTPLIRKDLLDELGLEMPVTIEEFTDTMETVLKAYPNIVGMVSKQDLLTQSSGGFTAAFGVNTPYYNEENGLVYNKLSPSFTNYVLWLKDMYSRGILSKEFSVMKPTQATELFQSGAAACLVNESMRWAYPFTQTLKQVKEDAYVEVSAPLKGEGGYALPYGTGIVDCFFISKAVPEDKMLKILDYLEETCTQEYLDFSMYGIEGVHYNVVNGERVLTEQKNIDMGSSAPQQVFARKYDAYMKVGSPQAPSEYNKQMRETFDSWNVDEIGTIDPFNVATSETWNKVWPKYINEWSAYATKAIIGQITIEEYQAYVDTLNNMPEFKTAYQEFAEAYESFEVEE